MFADNLSPIGKVGLVKFLGWLHDNTSFSTNCANCTKRTKAAKPFGVIITSNYVRIKVLAIEGLFFMVKYSYEFKKKLLMHISIEKAAAHFYVRIIFIKRGCYRVYRVACKTIKRRNVE